MASSAGNFKHVVGWRPMSGSLFRYHGGALNNWQEMASFALAATAVHWIIIFGPTLVLFRLSHSVVLECSKPSFRSPAFNSAAILLSSYVSVFAVCQLVMAAREQVDLIEGRPDWIFDPTFDVLGSPLLLIAVIALVAFRIRKT